MYTIPYFLINEAKNLIKVRINAWDKILHEAFKYMLKCNY